MHQMSRHTPGVYSVVVPGQYQCSYHLSLANDAILQTDDDAVGTDETYECGWFVRRKSRNIAKREPWRPLSTSVLRNGHVSCSWSCVRTLTPQQEVCFQVRQGTVDADVVNADHIPMLKLSVALVHVGQPEPIPKRLLPDTLQVPSALRPPLHYQEFGHVRTKQDKEAIKKRLRRKERKRRQEKEQHRRERTIRDDHHDVSSGEQAFRGSHPADTVYRPKTTKTRSTRKGRKRG